MLRFSKFCNVTAVVIHVHCVGGAVLQFVIFLFIWTSTDCYAPSVAPPSCPPLTALVTHAVYSPRAEGKTGEELHRALKMLSCLDQAIIFSTETKRDFVRLIVI